jgi:hypothetical protein
MMQLAAFTDFPGHKILLNYPSEQKARSILNKLKNEKALIFVDNFCDDVGGFQILNSNPNIRLIAFDREHNFEVISHMIDRSKFSFHSVTQMTEQDIQEIYSRIPESIRKTTLTFKQFQSDDEMSLFEFINLNIRYSNITERFKDIIEELESKDELLTDFLVLSSYVHHCRTPLSFDMAFSYFGHLIISYKEIYELRDNLGEMIRDYGYGIVDYEDQDYFSPSVMSI